MALVAEVIRQAGQGQPVALFIAGTFAVVIAIAVAGALRR